MKKINFFTAICLILTQVGVFAPAWAKSQGNIYYVSEKNGSDYYDGTEEKPFRTISKAADLMQAGDTCYIMGGVYHETVNMNIYAEKEHPVKFEAYNNDEVVITASEPITNWRKYDGNIYVADMDWDYNDGEGNMLFSNGVLCNEARWPNADDKLDIKNYAKAEVADKTIASITNSELPDIDYSGAVIWFNTASGFRSKASSVTGYDSLTKTINFKCSNTTSTYVPKEGSIFYVTRALGLLDSPGEWYKDKENGVIYFWTPDDADPNNINVEAKKREYTIIMDNSRFVEIKGIKVLGGNILTGADTQYCTWDDMVIESVDYNMPYGSSLSPEADAFTIYGKYNTLKNSEIKNCFADGVIVRGEYNNVINNFIHDVNFEHTYSDGVRVFGEYQFINHNTVTRTGRAALGGSFKKSEVSYNDFYDTMKLSIDGGVIYLVNNDYDSSEIHHNFIHDNAGSSGYQSGIYYDSNTTNVTAYNNVVWNIENGLEKARFLTLNTPGVCNVFFNNTFLNDETINYYPADGSLCGTVFINNIFTKKPFSDASIAEKNINYSNNLVISQDELNGDFTPKEGTEMINAGMKISGINDKTKDAMPDIGAYEYGEEIWTAGMQEEEVTDSFSLNYNIPFKNTVNNSGFEKGLNNWTTENGTPEIINMSAWNFSRLYTNEGSYGLMLKNNDCISQKITGLKPFSEYSIDAFAKIRGIVYQAEKADKKSKNNFITGNYKASGIIGNIKDGDWIGYSSVNFKDGEFNTVKILTNTTVLGGSIEIYIDSLEGKKIAALNYKTTVEGAWTDNSCIIDNTVTGVHDVYLLFKGKQENAFFGGFELYDSLSEDSVEIRAVSDNGEDKRIVYTDIDWQVNPEKMTVTTGGLGEIELFILKNKGNNIGYVDGIEAIGSSVFKTVDFIIDDIKILNNDFKQTTFLGDKAADILEFSAENVSDADREYVFTVTGYSTNGMEVGKSSITETVGAGKKVSFGMGINIPETEGSYMKLTVEENNEKVGEYVITNIYCANQRKTQEDFYIRRVWIENSTGLQQVTQEMVNNVNILISNHSGNSQNIDCIIALYDDEKRLISVVKMSDIAENNAMNVISKNISCDEKCSFGKIFVWQKDELCPLTELFNI